MDTELSPLVQRSFSLTASSQHRLHINGKHLTSSGTLEEENRAASQSTGGDAVKTVLKTVYQAATNRMLRVAVNGFMESLRLVLGVMEELDVDVLLVSA